MKRIIIRTVVALLLAASPVLRAFTGDVQIAGEVPAGFWNARLWLTSQAFGLEEDCPMRVLFQDPQFRSAATATGAVTSSRLAAGAMRGSDLFLVIETTRGGQRVERVTLQLRWHAAEGIVSVETIRLGDGNGADQIMKYGSAVNDDEEYDLYTDTLVSLYRSFFDPGTIRRRASATEG